ncbi:MAG TPA: hypothetical protein V6D18_00740 [Thermosynechococcaceae cyanobacterium]
MNWKLALLLPGAIVLAVAAAPILPGITAPTGTAIAQSQPRADKLNLTADQKAKLKQVREATQSKIQAVLTPEQRQQLETLKQQRQSQRQQGQKQPRAARQNGGMAALNLTNDQKAQIRQIRESAKQEMEFVFTPEQRQQLETLKQQRQSQRPQRRANPNAQPGV